MNSCLLFCLSFEMPFRKEEPWQDLRLTVKLWITFSVVWHNAHFLWSCKRFVVERHRKKFYHVYQPKTRGNNDFSEVAQVFRVTDLPAAIQLAGAACNNKVRGVCCVVFWLGTKYSIHVSTSATTVPRGPMVFHYNINKYLARQKQRWKKEVWLMTTDSPLALIIVQ